MKIVPVFNFKNSTSASSESFEFDLEKGISTHATMSIITGFVKSYLNKGDFNINAANGEHSFKMDDIHSVEFIIKGDE
jgi:hypothetical protein